MPLPDALNGEWWTPKIARHMLPWLVWLAKRRGTVTYLEVDAEVVRRGVHSHVHPAQYGHPAGAVGNALIEIGEAMGITIPPLNALVINKITRVPGDGCDWYLETFLGREIDFDSLSREDKLALVEEVQERIFAFDRWDEVLDYLGDMRRRYPELKPYRGKSLFGSEGRARAPKPSKRPPSKTAVAAAGLGGESDSHRSMKEFVATNPAAVGIPAKAAAKTEYLLWSADRADVLFSFGDTMVAVEVKSEVSSEADLYKGLHQCVKYRALLRAEQVLAGRVPNAKAVLAIAGEVPAVVAEHAERLNVQVLGKVEYRKRPGRRAAA